LSVATRMSAARQLLKALERLHTQRWNCAPGWVDYGLLMDCMVNIIYPYI
jgi:hypothetical protein